MDRPTYRVSTLGCRVNHAEARDLESVLIARGFRRAERGAPAEVEVVHTCTVTAAAAAKSRNAVRRAARRVRAKASGASNDRVDQLFSSAQVAPTSERSSP